jgi:DNA-binding protein H-NS
LLERVQKIFIERNHPAEILSGAVQLVPPPEIIAAYAELEKVTLLRKAITAAAIAYIADMKQVGKEVTAQQALTAGENAVLLENNKIQVWRGSGMRPHVLEHLERETALHAVNNP